MALKIKRELSIDDKIHRDFFKQTKTIEELLVWTSENNCSDLWIKVGEQPYISVFGKVKKLPCGIVTKQAWGTWYDKYVLNELNAIYVRNKTLDLSVEVRMREDGPDIGKFETNYYRYRCALAFSEEKNTATFRMIKPYIITFDKINYPEESRKAIEETLKKDGSLMLFTGATGQGKSTTMAATINTYSETLLNHKFILTLEDPIENNLITSDTFFVQQSELGRDFKSYPAGLKNALRLHPNYILLGEIRDAEVILTAIDGVKTGHGLVSTIHSGSVSGTIARLMYYLEGDINSGYDLLTHLGLIVSQRIIKSDSGYIVDTQHLMFNEEVTNALVEIIFSKEKSNISLEVEKMLKREDFIKKGYVKDWSFK